MRPFLLLAHLSFFCTLAVTDSDAQSTASGEGKFVAEYGQPTADALLEWYQWVRADSVADNVATFLNSKLSVPADIRIRFDECGTANAFYKPADRLIVFCYEFLPSIHTTIEQLEPDEQAAETLVQGTLYFFIYHEVGHALIDILDLLVGVAEESNADGFATYALAAGEDDSSAAREAVAAAVQYWLLEAGAREGMRIGEVRALLTDEHALDQQRLTQLACWLYGEDPELYAVWVDPEILPVQRATRCAKEFTALERFWERSLASYLKPDETETGTPDSPRRR